MILINGKIYTMAESGVIENGFVEIEKGKIKRVGKMSDYSVKGDEIDLLGKMVFPGFIDAHCHVGILEDSLTFEGDDLNESTEPVTPQLRGLDAVNPMDVCFKEACMAGVTTVATGPGSANVIGGTFAALKTYGNCVDEMIIKENVAMKYPWKKNMPRKYAFLGEMAFSQICRLEISVALTVVLPSKKSNETSK